MEKGAMKTFGSDSKELDWQGAWLERLDAKNKAPGACDSVQEKQISKQSNKQATMSLMASFEYSKVPSHELPESYWHH